jgi:hypothetical protein
MVANERERTEARESLATACILREGVLAKWRILSRRQKLQ